MTAALQSVLDAIDAANAADPGRETEGNECLPAAVLYGRRMSAVLDAFAPGASEALRIAVRGQHIERWTRPRGAYPEGRAGYLAWRRDAAQFHAGRVGAIMRAAGYDQAAADRVGVLIRKEAIKSDAEAQTLEDVACLVFMRWYFAPFAGKRTHEELYRIVAKTARKMSAAGRAAALKLPLPPELAPALAEADVSQGGR